jgi:hypothetical protein
MSTTFTGQTNINSNLEFSFQAKVDGVSVACVVAGEALGDIDPEYANSVANKQFDNSQSMLEDIARNKIENNEITNNQVSITAIDVAKYKST